MAKSTYIVHFAEENAMRLRSLLLARKVIFVKVVWNMQEKLFTPKLNPSKRANQDIN